jgi:hypothetical protein
MPLRLCAALAALALASPALARQPKAYQVTGTVEEVSDDLIVLLKGGKERFEIARTPDTKVTGNLTKGGSATVEYRMTATTAQEKPGKTGGATSSKKK